MLSRFETASSRCNICRRWNRRLHNPPMHYHIFPGMQVKRGVMSVIPVRCRIAGKHAGCLRFSVYLVSEYLHNPAHVMFRDITLRIRCLARGHVRLHCRINCKIQVEIYQRRVHSFSFRKFKYEIVAARKQKEQTNSGSSSMRLSQPASRRNRQNIYAIFLFIRFPPYFPNL